jgi:hypothetical protein
MENEKTIQIIRVFTWLIILSMLACTLMGCATNMPTAYGQYVEITDGLYKGERGRLIGDCSGFELYKVNLNKGPNVCIRSWNLERLY